METQTSTSKTILSAAFAVISAACVLTSASGQMAHEPAATASGGGGDRPVLGWSVRRAIFGKSVYTEKSEKVGKIEDLMIAPDRSIAFVVIAAGAFVGADHHDIAVPIAQIRDLGGKIVMLGATRVSVAATPAVDPTGHGAGREQLMIRADRDVEAAKDRVVQLQAKSSAAAGDLKVTLDGQIERLQQETKLIEAKLELMRRAGASRWREFAVDVSAAAAHLRKTVEATAG